MRVRVATTALSCAPDSQPNLGEAVLKPKAGIPFLVIGIAFITLGISGQKAFIAIGIVFMALGAAFLARARRAP